MKCREIGRVFNKYKITRKRCQINKLWNCLFELFDKDLVPATLSWAGRNRRIAEKPTKNASLLRTYDSCIFEDIRALPDDGLEITVEFWEGDILNGEPRYEDPGLVLCLTLPPDFELPGALEEECMYSIQREAVSLYRRKQQEEERRMIQSIVQQMLS